MQTRRTRRRNDYVRTKKGVPCYRRVIPPELRARFDGKREFTRSLKAMSWDKAHAEFERIARGDGGLVQPVSPQWPPDADEGYLRALAEEGGDAFHSHVAHLERWASETRAKIALGVITDPIQVASLEAYAAKYERLARQARGEKPVAAVTLQDAADKFMATVTVEGTISSYRPKLADIVEALGVEKNVRTIQPTEVRAFAEIVHTFPSNRRKKWPTLSLPEAIKRGKEDGAPCISPETQRAYVALARTFFGWCEDAGLIASSPATKLPRPKGKRGTRKDFDADQLNLLFNSAPFKPDQRDEDPAMFWVFPIALFSGMRRDEVIRLRKHDVKHERGVHYFDLKEDTEAGRTLKTPSSIRGVPVHPTLIRMGFLDHVAKLKDGSWLFPGDLMKAQRPGDAFGKRWARHLDALGITDKGLTFHSLRHTFSTAMRECGVEKAYRDRLGGWSGGGVAESYGKYDLKTLHRELSKLTYEVKLTHLYRR